MKAAFRCKSERRLLALDTRQLLLAGLLPASDAPEDAPPTLTEAEVPDHSSFTRIRDRFGLKT